MQTVRYPGFFCEGPTLDASTKVEPAKVWFDGDSLTIESKAKTIRLPLANVLEIELRRIGLMTAIRIRTSEGIIHLAATRLLIGRSFAIVNVLRTRKIYARIASSAPNR